jgi:hypothetical protein
MGACDGFSPNAYAEADLIATFTDSMRIIPCPEVPVVNVENTLMRKASFVGPHNVM